MAEALRQSRDPFLLMPLGRPAGGERARVGGGKDERGGDAMPRKRLRRRVGGAATDEQPRAATPPGEPSDVELCMLVRVYDRAFRLHAHCSHIQYPGTTDSIPKALTRFVSRCVGTTTELPTLLKRE